MDNPIEYLFGGRLRWGFGFDNPNKAAVVFVCLLPLLWIAWNRAWHAGGGGGQARPVRSQVGRWAARLACGAAILAAFGALCLTFSRGGLAAAAVACAYIGVRTRRAGAGRTRRVGGAVLLAVALGTVVLTGLGERSTEPLVRSDASTGNRLVVWKYALAMAADRPGGFGVGKSGAAYVQWYQPLDRDERYRTLVSGWLTPLVEFGWPLFASAVLLLAAWWAWAEPRGSRVERDTGPPPGAVALRALLAGFAASALFSTTIEEARLWVLPAGAAAALTAWTIRTGSRVTTRRAGATLGACAVGLVTIYAAGLAISARDPLRREFRDAEAVTIGPRGGANRCVAVVPDRAVFGDVHGPMLRELAVDRGWAVEIRRPMQWATPAETLILAGGAVAGAVGEAAGRIVLVSPAVMPEADAARLLASGRVGRIFVPEIDEDGRTQFWREVAGGAGLPVESIPGVGTRIDWAWSAVADEL